jgi:hypothetical protein
MNARRTLSPALAVCRYTRVILILLFTAKVVSASTIGIDLGPPAVYTTDTQVGPVAFSDLNGTPVNGSTVSLDFSFSNGEFVRLYSNTDKSFEIGLGLHTDAGTFPGFVTNATGYLIAQNGSAIPGFGVVGRSDSSNGSTFLGLFPLFADSSGTPDNSLSFPLDFYGVHFTFTLPNDPSVDVIGSDFSLFGKTFAVGPPAPSAIVADTGGTMQLFFVSTILLVAIQHWLSRRARKSIRGVAR